MGDELDSDNDQMIKEYLIQRSDYFEKKLDDEVLYNSLLQFLWYTKLKNTCPITGAQLAKGKLLTSLNNIILCMSTNRSRSTPCLTFCFSQSATRNRQNTPL